MYHKEKVGVGSQMDYTISGSQTRTGKWGLGDNSPQFNVRFESLKTIWAGYYKNRGVVELNGFFEHGYYFHEKDDKPLMAAVLYDDVGDFALITRGANELVRAVHNRQPLLLDPAKYELWLDRALVFTMFEPGHLVRVGESKARA